MQALRNKLHGKSKRNTGTTNDKKFIEERTETVTTTRDVPSFPSPVTETTQTTTITETPLVDNFSSIPTPPPMPPTDFYTQGNTNIYDQYFLEDSVAPLLSTRSMEMLPTEVIEKPFILHESIRQEQVEEIQPIVHVEREKTEIRQITQPLTDKEIMPTIVEERVLPIEILPTITEEFVPVVDKTEESTRVFETAKRQVVEKQPIIQETERWRVIEEIQPIIYRETIVPHIIRTSRPMREVVVEAPVFTQMVLGSRDLSAWERERYAHFLERSAPREVLIKHAPVSKSVPITPASGKTIEKKEIIEDTITTTTTTTVAPTVGSSTSGMPSSAILGSGLAQTSTGSAPTVVEEKHTESQGPMGQKIVTDIKTTKSHTATVLPTFAK